MPKKKVIATSVEHITRIHFDCPYCGADMEDEVPLDVDGHFKESFECGECEKTFVYEVEPNTQNET